MSQKKQGCEDAGSLTDKGRRPREREWGSGLGKVTVWTGAGSQDALCLLPGGGWGLRLRVSAGSVLLLQWRQAQSQVRPAVSDVLGVRQAEVRRGSPARAEGLSVLSRVFLLSPPALGKAGGCAIRLSTFCPLSSGHCRCLAPRECFSRPDGARWAICGWVGGRHEALLGGREAVGKERRPLPAHVEGK